MSITNAGDQLWSNLENSDLSSTLNGFDPKIVALVMFTITYNAINEIGEIADRKQIVEDCITLLQATIYTKQ